MSLNKYILAPNCFVIDGAKNSILIDLQKQTFKVLPKDIREIFNVEWTSKTIKEFSEEKSLFFKSLYSEDIILKIETEVTTLFEQMNDKFYNKSQVHNMIWELSLINLHLSTKIINSLNLLGCQHIELRVLPEINIQDLLSFVKQFKNTTIHTIDIYFRFENIETINLLVEMQSDLLELRWIYVYNTPKEVIQKLSRNPTSGILLLNQNIENKSCGNIEPFYFAINIPTYTESKHFNTCLNCKISIDKDGFVKNCPSLNKKFGNIKDKALEEIIAKPSLKKLWNIKKDDIKVCKDCEFRHICTDCRAYVEDPKDLYSKPLKCGYDPYTGKWEEWSTNPLKQKAIKYYEMEDLVRTN